MTLTPGPSPSRGRGETGTGVDAALASVANCYGPHAHAKTTLVALALVANLRVGTHILQPRL